jgi:protease IV
MNDLIKAIRQVAIAMSVSAATNKAKTQYKKVKRGDFIAKIELNGHINGYSDRKPGLNPDTVERLIGTAIGEKAKGIIFQINSQGGGVVPSKDIGDMIKDVKIPKVALVRGMAASGGYWIASACDYIVANEFSVVGSIGVRMDMINYKGLIDMLGVKHETIKSGKHKDIGSHFRELSNVERKFLQDHADEAHEAFICEVAANRNLETGKIRNIAEGLVYSGRKAIKLGLIDKLGGQKQAVQYLEEKTELKNLKVVPMKVDVVGIFRQVLEMSSEIVGHSFMDGVYRRINSEKFYFK